MKRAFTILLGIFVLLIPGRMAQVRSDDRNQLPHKSTSAVTLKPKLDLTEAPDGYTLSQLEFFETYCFTEVNRYRESQNFSPLIYLPEALPVARGYSRRMAEEGFFSHTDPQGATAKERLLGAGIKYLALGENLSRASGYLDGNRVVLRLFEDLHDALAAIDLSLGLSVEV